MPEYLTDGLSTCEGGVDSGKAPVLLQVNQIAWGQNVDLRGGFARPRPGIWKINLNFDSDVIRTRFEDGRFQVADYYNPDVGPETLIVSIGGRQFRINVATDNSVDEITISGQTFTSANFVPPAIGTNVTIQVVSTGNLSVGSQILVNGFTYSVSSIISPTQVTITNVDDPGTVNPVPSGSAVVYYQPNSSTIDQAWMTQAEKWMILQDGQSLPWIYDGSSARRSIPALNEIKVGRMMAYGMGRLWYALPDQRSFRAGDLVGSSSGTAAEQFRDAVLKETQNTYLTNGDFVTPTSAGGIKAMRFVATLDTSLGQGPLQVLTPNTSFSVDAPFDASTWAALQNPIQTISNISYGGLSQYGSILVNGDLVYRALDGVRSLILARREFQTWSNTPFSREMNRIIDYDDTKLLNFSSAVVFDNRLYMTVSPTRTDHGIYHRAWITMDYDLASSIGQKSNPVWTGMGTGVNVLQFVKGEFNGVERCFIFSLNGDQEIELYELTNSDKFDRQSANGPDVPIFWAFETRSFRFSTDLFPEKRVLKELIDLELEIRNMVGNVRFTAYFKPDNYPCWIFWKEWTDCAEYKDCSVGPDGCLNNLNFKPQNRPRVNLGMPPNSCDELTNRLHRHGYSFQVRLEVEGYCEIPSLFAKTAPRVERTYGSTMVC